LVKIKRYRQREIIRQEQLPLQVGEKTMKKIVLTIGVLVLLTGGTAYAALTWSELVQIERIEAAMTGGADGVWLRFTSEPFPSHTCPGRDGYYRLGGNYNNVERMTTLALAARLHTQPVRVLFDGGCSADGRPVLVGLELRR
jgi:hypothetical protein